MRFIFIINALYSFLIILLIQSTLIFYLHPQDGQFILLNYYLANQVFLMSIMKVIIIFISGPMFLLIMCIFYLQ
jgi:hypothetical protein